MQQRHHNSVQPFGPRLSEEAERLREQAKTVPPGVKREWGPPAMGWAIGGLGHETSALPSIMLQKSQKAQRPIFPPKDEKSDNRRSVAP
jgi:hypothetical protein